MPEGKFCNKKPIDTAEGINELLSDTSGNHYYKEMEELEIDSDLL